MSATLVLDRPMAFAPSDPKDRAKPQPVGGQPASELAVTPEARRNTRKRLLLGGVATLVLAGATWAGYNYWSEWRFQVSTDDAYVQADSVTIAPKVTGYLTDVLVNDNERVHQGQMLARIDPRDYQAALDQAAAATDAASAKADALRSTIDQQRAQIEQARATLGVDQANLTFAQQDYDRYSQLAARGNGSVQNAQQATSRIQAVQATLQRDEAALAAATSELGTLTAELKQAQADVAEDQARQRQAELNLGYTTITAPADGVVGARTLRVGQYVQPGTQLMAVVPLDQAYIVANYKETQLTDVRPGQPVSVEVDMFPGVVVAGHVDSLSPASGQSFALLPPDNATGNFTKIVQRIAVKIVVDPSNPLAGALRPGMSVYPTIDVQGTEAPDRTSVRLAANGAHS